MALDNYADLQTEIANWMNRSDLTAEIPTFITLAETEIKRRMRRLTINTQIFVSSEYTALPNDCAELRSIVLVTNIPGQKPLQICSIDQLAVLGSPWIGTVAQPRFAAASQTAVRVAPLPDTTYTANISYYQSLQTLSTTNTTNTVLTEYPDVYLYGSLLAAEPYMEHDERIPTWRQAFDRAIDQINQVVDREEFGASFKRVRFPRTF